MSQDASCPYCDTPASIQVREDDFETIRIRCSKCGGVYEFMPDFGSFSLPDQGQDFSPTRSIGATRYRSEYEISTEDTPEASAGAACCFTAVCILLSILLPVILILLFGF